MSFADLTFEPKEAREHLLSWRIPEAISAYGEAIAKATDPLQIRFFQHRLAQAHFRTFDLEAGIAQAGAAVSGGNFAGNEPGGDALLAAMEALSKATAENLTEELPLALWDRVVALLERAIGETQSASDELVREYLEALVGSAGRGSREALEKAKLTVNISKCRAGVPQDLYLGLIDVAEHEVYVHSTARISPHLIAAQEADPDSHSLKAILADAYCDAACVARRLGIDDGIRDLKFAFGLIRDVVLAVPGVVKAHRILARVSGHYAGALSLLDPEGADATILEARGHFEALAAAHPADPRVWRMLSWMLACYCMEREGIARREVRALQERLEEKTPTPLYSAPVDAWLGTEPTSRDEPGWNGGRLVTDLLVSE